MTDLTEALHEGDWFRFQRVSIQARKLTKPVIQHGSESHRASKILAEIGICLIDKQWRLSNKRIK